MRRHWTVALVTTCAVLVLAVVTGFVIASTSLADQPGAPVEVGAVIVEPAPGTNTGTSTPPPSSTPTPEPTGAITVPDPPPVEVDDHGGDSGNSGKGGSDGSDDGPDDSGHGGDD